MFKLGTAEAVLLCSSGEFLQDSSGVAVKCLSVEIDIKDTRQPAVCHWKCFSDSKFRCFFLYNIAKGTNYFTRIYRVSVFLGLCVFICLFCFVYTGVCLAFICMLTYRFGNH